MKQILKFTLAVAVASMLCLNFSSCGKKGGDGGGDDTPEKLSLNELYYCQTQMTAYLALESDPDSGYPESAFTALKSAKTTLDANVEKAKDGTFTKQKQVDDAASAAMTAIKAFEDSFVFVARACELFVPAASDASNYIQFPPLDGYNQRTISVECWFKGVTKINSQRQGVIFSSLAHRGGDDFDGWNLNFWGEDEDGNGPYNLRATRGFQGMGASGDHLIEPGAGYFRDDAAKQTAWHHIVSVYDENASENQIKIYLDGNLHAQATDPSWTADRIGQRYRPNTTDMLCAFKSISNVDNHMGISGSIKKVRFWSKALTAAEATANMTAEVTGTEANLIAAWDFTETVQDASNIPDKTGNRYAAVIGSDVEWKIEK